MQAVKGIVQTAQELKQAQYNPKLEAIVIENASIPVSSQAFRTAKVQQRGCISRWYL